MMVCVFGFVIHLQIFDVFFSYLEDEEDQFVSDAYGVKMRGPRSNSPKPNSTPKASTNEEDDLRWVEDNIPTAIADAALPILDSDEEIINTRFEVSKMQ